MPHRLKALELMEPWRSCPFGSSTASELARTRSRDPRRLLGAKPHGYCGESTTDVSSPQALHRHLPKTLFQPPTQFPRRHDGEASARARADFNGVLCA